MAAEIKWTALSLEDIENIARFIAKDSEQYALIQTERFFERVRILEAHPEFGKIVPEIGSPSVRQLIEGNYRIIYLTGQNRYSNYPSQEQIAIKQPFIRRVIR